MSGDLLDGIYPSRAAATLAAKNAGWRPHPNDRDVYMRGAHRIRITAHGRDWCWTEIGGAAQRCTAVRSIVGAVSLLQHWCTLPPGHEPPHVCGCNATFTTGEPT